MAAAMLLVDMVFSPRLRRYDSFRHRRALAASCRSFTTWVALKITNRIKTFPQVRRGSRNSPGIVLAPRARLIYRMPLS